MCTQCIAIKVSILREYLLVHGLEMSTSVIIKSIKFGDWVGNKLYLTIIMPLFQLKEDQKVISTVLLFIEQPSTTYYLYGNIYPY